MGRAWGYFPDLYSQRVWRRECIEVRDNQLGGRVREVVAPDIGVCPDLVEGGA